MRLCVSSPDENNRKYDVQRSIFDELRGVSFGDETINFLCIFFMNC